MAPTYDPVSGRTVSSSPGQAVGGRPPANRSRGDI